MSFNNAYATAMHFPDLVHDDHLIVTQAIIASRPLKRVSSQMPQKALTLAVQFWSLGMNLHPSCRTLSKVIISQYRLGESLIGDRPRPRTACFTTKEGFWCGRFL